MRVLLITPPMTQLNAPYPATAYLTGYLRRKGVDTVQVDASLLLALRLFSQSGLEMIHEELSSGRGRRHHKPTMGAVRFFLKHYDQYSAVVDPVIRFLQGHDPTVAHRICTRELIPEGPRFDRLHELEKNDPEALDWAFGSLGVTDKAKYLAGLFVDDLADLVHEGIDPLFALARYGEHLVSSEPSFDPLQMALNAHPTLVVKLIEDLTRELMACHKPDLVGLSVPFVGNVYSAFHMARLIKSIQPQIKTALGGGFVNTELRQLSEPRVFDYFDFVSLDDGQQALLFLIEYLCGKRSGERLLSTYVRENGRVVLKSKPGEEFRPETFKEMGPPVYDGLPLEQYLSICEVLNPMRRLWSDARWNKLSIAHGCYWRRCRFCDACLDYVARYESLPAQHIVEQIETVIEETGQTGFHFVDEAAPPAALVGMAEKLIERRLAITWWGNIRFERAFTREKIALLAKSGCIAVTGGIEVPVERILKLMDKGVTLEQAIRVMKAFVDHGILVHAYLIYAFPTQTRQETIDGLECVRQMFIEGCLHSAYWHRFALTTHSAMSRDPEKFGIRLRAMPEVRFAVNEIDYEETNPTDHDRFGPGLQKAVYNYMHGVGLESDVRDWFDFDVPKTKVPRNFVKKIVSR